MANIVKTGINSAIFAFNKPIWALVISLIILLMPLNAIDFILYIIVNIGVALFNVLYWLLVFFANLLIGVLNIGIELIFNVVEFITGGSDPPELDLFVYEQQPYTDVDLFSDNFNNNLLSKLLSLF